MNRLVFSELLAVFLRDAVVTHCMTEYEAEYIWYAMEYLYGT